MAITNGYKDESAPNGEQAMCCFCSAAIEDHLMETAPQTTVGRGTGSEQDEWSAMIALATKIGLGTTAIRGWQLGTAKDKRQTPLSRARAADFFPKAGAKLVLEVGNGKVRPKLSKMQLEKSRWREKERLLLLMDQINVERRVIEGTPYFMADAKERMLQDHDMATLKRMHGMLLATGARAVVQDKGLE